MIKVEEAAAQVTPEHLAALDDPGAVPVVTTALTDLQTMVRNGEGLVAVLDGMVGVSRTLDLSERLNVALVVLGR